METPTLLFKTTSGEPIEKANLRLNRDKSRDFPTPEDEVQFFITECEKEKTLANIFISKKFLENFRTTNACYVEPHLKVVHKVLQHKSTHTYLKKRCNQASLQELSEVVQSNTEHMRQLKEILDKYCEENVITEEQYLDSIIDLNLMQGILKSTYAERLLPSQQFSWNSIINQGRKLLCSRYTWITLGIGYLGYKIYKRLRGKPKPNVIAKINDNEAISTF